MGNDQLMVERVVYLASLVSDKNTIDPLLDTLRFITSKREPGQQLELTADERTKMSNLETQLSEHLVNKDPVRAFTTDSLKSKLAEHFASSNPRAQANRKTRRLVFMIFGLAFLGYGLGMATIPAELNARFTLAAPIMMLVIGIGIAWMFWSSRQLLAPTMKTSFGLFAAALIISTITSAQYPILSAYPHLSDLDFLRYGGFIAPYVAMYATFYAGFYLYARQLQASIKILRPWWVTLTAVALIPVAILLPHPVTTSELFFDSALSCFLLNILFSGAAAVLGFAVVVRVTERYQRALRLFALSTATYTIVSLGLGTMLLVTGELPPADPRVAGISSLYTVALILQISAAYLLKRDLQE